MPRTSNQKGFALVEGLLILVIICLVGGVGYYVWHAQKATNNAYNSAAKVALSSPASDRTNWIQYHNTDYGFKLTYPPYWGKPVFQYGKGVVGAQYNLFFRNSNSGKLTGTMISIYLETRDFVFEGCGDAGCHEANTDNTKAAVEAVLQGIKAGTNFTHDSYTALAYSDDNSYIGLLTNPGAGETDVLDGHQIVSLSKMNVEAVSIDYEQLGVSEHCTMLHVSPESVKPCISQKDVATVSTVLKSIQSL